MDLSRSPDMTLSIGSPSFGTVTRRDATACHSHLAQSPWSDAKTCAPGSKRKREKEDPFLITEISGLSFEDDNDVRCPTRDFCRSNPCNSGFSAEGGTSRGTTLISGVTEEEIPIGLGLGLAGPNLRSVSDNFTAAMATSDIPERTMNRFIKTHLKSPGNVTDSPPGFGPSHCNPISVRSRGDILKGFSAMDDTRMEKNIGMQLQLSLSNGSTVISDDDCVSHMPFGQQSGIAYPDTRNGSLYDETVIAADDEGSTSGHTRKTRECMPTLVLGCRDSVFLEKDEDYLGQSKFAHQGPSLGHDNKARQVNEPPGNVDALRGKAIYVGPPASAERTTRICKFPGCSKGARGASGLCITHGGGRRCQRPGCNRGAEGRTVYCKSHGGGRRCQSLGCTKSAEGRTEYCISHGGGRRCSQDGCNKAARGSSGLCIKHGGGKRCKEEGCMKSAEGYPGLCISHGGGRRCQVPECSKGAQGNTKYCKGHGGGKRCIIQGCTKGAEGSTPLCKGHGGGKRCMFDGGGMCTKSVHGGTSFCVAHGGGKRCAIEGCTKSARGRTSYCVKHGGGKRCKYENCAKSAQGSSDFCKAHGGGKRCSWGQETSPYMEFVNDKTRELLTGPCDRFARGKIGLCAAHSALVQDRRVHGAEIIGSALPAGIGPGLFRGLVNRLSNDGMKVDAASKDASHKHAQGSEAWCQYICEKGTGSGSLQRDSGIENLGSFNNQASFAKDKTQHNGIGPESSVGRNTGLVFEEIDLTIAQNQTNSQTKQDSTTTVLNNCCIPSAYILNKLKPNQTINVTDGFLSANYCTDVGASTFRNAFSNRERHVLLPPQVLVPPSMKMGQFLPSLGRGDMKCVKMANARGSGDSNFSFLPNCEARVHGGREERVHGGSAVLSSSGKKDISRI